MTFNHLLFSRKAPHRHNERPTLGKPTDLVQQEL